MVDNLSADEDLTEKERKKIETYMYLTTLPRAPKIDEINQIIAKTGQKKWSLMGMIGQAKRNANIYTMIRSHGFDDKQIAPWFARPGDKPPVEDIPDESPVVGSASGLPLPTPAGPALISDPSDASDEVAEKSQDTAPLGGISPESPETGDKREQTPTDIDEQKRTYLKTVGVFQQSDGTWVQAMPDGGDRVRLKQVDPLAFLQPDQDGGAGKALSQLMFKEMDVKVQTIVRKIGLNPDVHQCWNWAKNKINEETGEPFFLETEDIGDFINWAVMFSMKWCFGARPMMSIGGPSLMQMVKQNRRRLEPVV